MKQFLLWFLFLSSFWSKAQHVQISFTENYQIGIAQPFPGSPSEGAATTDTALNAVFTQYGVQHCYEGYSWDPYIFAQFTGTDLAGFLNDLTTVPNVVGVKVCEAPYTFANLLYVKFAAAQNIAVTGINPNGNIITSYEPLNVIFDDFEVFEMSQLIPNSTYYTIAFKGNIAELKPVLDAFNSAVDNTDLVPVVMLLGTEKFDPATVTVYPNPFSTSFAIDTKEAISSYSIFDVSGKQLLNTKLKSVLENKASVLQSGIYLLKIQTQNGEVLTKKIVKK